MRGSARTTVVFGGMLAGALLGCGGGTETTTAEDPAATTGGGGETAGSDPAPSGTTPAVVYEGLSTPESVLYDPDADVYLVSNVEGSAVEADGVASIARLKPDGTFESRRWICSRRDHVPMNAPKGMGFRGDELFVTDIDHVRVFERATGRSKRAIRIEGATFLNDIAVSPEGIVYVSDSGLRAGAEGFEPTGTDAIYRIEANDSVHVVMRSTELGRPNGLFVDDLGVWVVTFGSGELYRIGPQSSRLDVTPIAGSLDGLVRLDDGSWLVASWERSAILRGQVGGSFEPVIEGATSPADIGFDTRRRRVLVPLFTQNRVQVYDLP